jgi:hypothetical protein
MFSATLIPTSIWSFTDGYPIISRMLLIFYLAISLSLIYFCHKHGSQSDEDRLCEKEEAKKIFKAYGCEHLFDEERFDEKEEEKLNGGDDEKSGRLPMKVEVLSIFLWNVPWALWTYFICVELHFIAFYPGFALSLLVFVMGSCLMILRVAGILHRAQKSLSMLWGRHEGMFVSVLLACFYARSIYEFPRTGMFSACHICWFSQYSFGNPCAAIGR